MQHSRMAAKGQTITKAHREAIRQAALARHSERKAAGLPAPSGLPYIAPPDPPTPDPVVLPEPVAVPAVAVPAVAAANASPSALPLLIPNPALVAPLPPRQAFAAWLCGREGVSACDTRMSRDAVRFGAELEDRLFIAWQAGYQTGRAEV